MSILIKCRKGKCNSQNHNFCDSWKILVFKKITPFLCASSLRIESYQERWRD